MSEPLVKLDGISKSYGEKRALRDISLEIGERGVVGLLGRNGAGKSTMMNIMTGYIPASGGRVSIRGVDMAENPRKAKRHIGYLPEQPPLYDSMTVFEYLAFVAKIKNLPRGEAKAEVGRICGEMGLAEVQSRLLRNLSKGYRQRVGVAQAMLGAPDILILDEPTAGLDPKQIVEIRSLIRDFGKNRTVLISSHILAEIAEICERVLILRDGKLAGDCRMETLGDSRAGFGKLQIRVTGGKNECERMLRNVEGIKSFSFLRVVEHGTTDWELEFSREGTDMREALFDEIAKAKMKLLMSKPIEASIEDVFLQMTADERPSQATP